MMLTSCLVIFLQLGILETHSLSQPQTYPPIGREGSSLSYLPQRMLEDKEQVHTRLDLELCFVLQHQDHNTQDASLHGLLYITPVNIMSRKSLSLVAKCFPGHLMEGSFARAPHAR